MTTVARVCPVCSTPLTNRDRRAIYCSRRCFYAHRRTSLTSRFWANVSVGAPDACWLWRGAKRRGYGVIGVGRTSGTGKQIATHRLSYEIHNGPIPDGAIVRHRCDVQACCNPAHLELGTLLDNNNDRDQRGRTSHAGAPRRITDRQVALMRAMLARGVPGRTIANKFSVSDQFVSNIKHGKKRFSPS